MKYTSRLILSNRLWNSKLLQKEKDLSRLVSNLLGFQAQYHSIGLFNIFIRTPFTDIEEIKDLCERKSIIRAWGSRQTLHFYTIETWQLITNLLRHQKSWPSKYFQNKGIDPEAVSHQLYRFLKIHTKVNKEDIRQHFGDISSILFSWSALFLKASREGFLTVAPNSNRYQFFNKDKASFNDRIAMNQLLYDYLNSYGPATKNDFAHFLGVNQSFINPYFDETLFNCLTYNNEKLYYIALLPNIEIPKVLLLGKFDPLLLAYSNKQWLCSDNEKRFILLYFYGRKLVGITLSYSLTN